MTQPSDETFLDEMAQRPFKWLRTTETGVAIVGIELELAERDRLVALARRAPALTCGTCQFWDGRGKKMPENRHRCLAHDGVSEELFCEVDVMWTKATFYCKLHAPAPTEPSR